MNLFAYVGYMLICLVIALVFMAVFLGIFVCIDNWYEDHVSNKEDKDA